MNTVLHNLLITVLAGFLLTAPGSQAAPPASPGPSVIHFGVVPQQAASRLAKLWIPVLDYLGEKTGYSFRFRTATDIPAFEAACAAGEYDLAYMNPYHYTVFRKSPGYRALAKEKDKQIRGIIVVRKDSPMQELGDLDGRTLAFPSPLAFAASMLPRAYLKNRGIHVTPRYVSSHDSVYRTVAKGLYPAGGGVERTYNNTTPEVREQLRILWSSEGYTPHAIAAHPRMDTATAERILQAMLEMDQDPRGAALLQTIRFTGIEAASDAAWDSIEALTMPALPTGGM